ncbi:MAG: glycosidase, partial [Candidatus Latescibacteria bacterium]|nr:glycosidase [bacterium]MBD3424060.1 glycosidase [Candidatus Latescibacterota bacterium]
MKSAKTNLLGRIAAVICMVLLLSPVVLEAAGSGKARVVKDMEGVRLQVDGEDFMVFGMNWDYFPIGTNYLFSIWEKPDEFIIEALDREMPLLKEMGVNVIRQYVGIPPRWVEYIYEKYGIYTIVNHPVGRYGYTLGGVWIPSVDYSDGRFREAVKEEILQMAEQFRGVPGMLMYLLGNENNYGLHWTSVEAEALPEGERDDARAGYLYSLYQEIIDEIKNREPDRLVGIVNGDLQYLDIIAQECSSLDVFGTNVYRGISARDLFARVKKELGVPVMFTEFGADAWNEKEMREDQVMQAKYLKGQWKEIYQMSSGKGRVGNAIGGLIFQWTDGWWKFGQDSRLDIHDTNASWPNDAYPEDYVEGANNMNEEWWGIAAKGPTDKRGLYEVYPRAAYYVLKKAFTLDPYARGTDLAKIEKHFDSVNIRWMAVEARSDKAALLAEEHDMVQLSNVRVEYETYNTGGERISTPERAASSASDYPAFQGFDHMQSAFVEFRGQPSAAVTGELSVNILGNVPVNPIDEIFYENRGRPVQVKDADGENLEVLDLQRVKIYKGTVSWDSSWFRLDGFYREGHLHWQHEGDFFGLYRDAYYGENIDIYNGEAPVGMELTGKRDLSGWKLAFGPQLWWGANPAVLIKYRRDVGPFEMTSIYQEDLTRQSSITSSYAIPLPETRKFTVAVKASRGSAVLELGGIVSGSPRIDETFQVVEGSGDNMRVLQDRVEDSDIFGAKAKLTIEKGRWHWYAQAAYMGLVAEAGPTKKITFTDWNLKDSGSGNQVNAMTGVAVNLGSIQIAPNFLWQKPLVDPVPADAPAPGRPRNILDDPFSVRANRETYGAELMLNFDPTPGSWMWSWDNDLREDARFAASLGYVFRHYPTT